jgi:phosphoglycolate phosphatase
MKRRPLIIFDLDGTLYETGSVLVKAVTMAAADLGLAQPSEGRILAGIGLKSGAFCDEVLPEADAETRGRFSRLCSQYERELIGRFGGLYDGVREALSDLVNLGADLAICTHGSEAYARSILASFDLEDYFVVIKGASDQCTKTELVAEIIAEVGTDWAIVVGDRESDRRAARSHNLPFILTNYGYSDIVDSEQGFFISKPSELPPMVRRLAVFDRVHTDLRSLSISGPVIVGVTGIDASGKTEFAKALGSYLGEVGRSVQLIHLDDFHNPAAVRRLGPDERTAYIRNAFNLELLTKECLAKARDGYDQPIVLRLLDLDSDEYTVERSYQFNERTVVIVEGVLLYREPLDEYFDYRIFLHITLEEMRIRVRTRDVLRFGEGMVEKYERKYIPVQNWFLKTCRPRERSDLIVDNTDFRNPRVVASDQAESDR